MFERDVDELDAAETLAASTDAQADRTRADLALIELSLRFADLNPDPATVPGHVSLPGGERVWNCGGPGCPGFAEFAAAEFGAAIGRSAGSAAAFIGQSLALRHRLPLILAMVRSGHGEPWKARTIATACLALSVEAAAIVDRRVARIIDTVTPIQLEKIVKAAIQQADPDGARATAEQNAKERGVWAGRVDEHGTTTLTIRASTGDVIRFKATLRQLADALAELGHTGTLGQRMAMAVGIISDPTLTQELLTLATHLTPPDQRANTPAPDTNHTGTPDTEPTPAPTTNNASTPDIAPHTDRASTPDADRTSAPDTEPTPAPATNHASNLDTNSDTDYASNPDTNRTSNPDTDWASDPDTNHTSAPGTGPAAAPEPDAASAPSTAPPTHRDTDLDGEPAIHAEQETAPQPEPKVEPDAETDGDAAAATKPQARRPMTASTDAEPAASVASNQDWPADWFAANEPPAEHDPDWDPPHPSDPLYDHTASPEPSAADDRNDHRDSGPAEFSEPPEPAEATDPAGPADHGSRADDAECPDQDPGMDAAARRELARKLAAIRHNATRQGLSSTRRPAQTTLYIHLTDQTLLAGEGVTRVERYGPVFTTRLEELLGHSQIIIKPVIDLNDNKINVNAYEVPDRIRERVKLTHPVEQFPYGVTETTNSTDLDHIQPYNFTDTGPPGQTSVTNLTPLRRYSHRVKTHGDWQSRRLDDGALEWTTRHGLRFRVDHQGTHRLTNQTDHPDPTEPSEPAGPAGHG